MAALFAYGTLMCDDILSTVAGCELPTEPASLAGFRRLAVQGEAYPGLVRWPGMTVQGVLARAVPASAWVRLDRFEGDMYERLTVRVQCADGGTAVADTYLVRPAFRHCLAAGDWDFEHFLHHGKQGFRSHYRGYDSLG